MSMMEQVFKQLDAYGMLRATDAAKGIAERAVKAVDAFQIDKDKQQRLEETICRTCFYFRRSRIGGAAITRWCCGVCGRTQTAPSTATDKVCRPCGQEHLLCVQCGGDLETRVRRRKWPTPPTFKEG
jgi:hypothetical protein